MGGGAAGLGFSEMVARTANLRKGDGSGKARGELRAEISAAVERAKAGEAAGGDGHTYPEHVFESIETMDEDRVNIDAMAALVHFIDEHREPGAILVFMPGRPHACWDPALTVASRTRTRRTRAVALPRE